MVLGKSNTKVSEKYCWAPVEEVLPVMKVKVNGMDRIALVDSGFSLSVVSGMLCRPKVWKSTTILTAGRKCLLSHGVGSKI